MRRHPPIHRHLITHLMPPIPRKQFPTLWIIINHGIPLIPILKRNINKFKTLRVRVVHVIEAWKFFVVFFDYVEDAAGHEGVTGPLFAPVGSVGGLDF